MGTSRFLLALAVAAILGVGITWIDMRPGWDDAGLTAGAIFVVTLACGAVAPRPWAFALAVAAWIPVVGLARDRNYGSLLALAVGFAGAYAGALLRWMRRT